MFVADAICAATTESVIQPASGLARSSKLDASKCTSQKSTHFSPFHPAYSSLTAHRLVVTSRRTWSFHRCAHAAAAHFTLLLALQTRLTDHIPSFTCVPFEGYARDLIGKEEAGKRQM